MIPNKASLRLANLLKNEMYWAHALPDRQNDVMLENELNEIELGRTCINASF